MLQDFTLKISAELAHKQAVEPDTRYRLRHGDGHADSCDEQIRHGQVHQKVVGHAVTSTQSKLRIRQRERLNGCFFPTFYTHFVSNAYGERP